VRSFAGSVRGSSAVSVPTNVMANVSGDVICSEIWLVSFEPPRRASERSTPPTILPRSAAIK
jgi:hypothetical protein